jgi:ATP-binding cassette subfamily C protein
MRPFSHQTDAFRTPAAHLALLGQLLKDLFQFNPKQAAVSFLLMFTKNLTAGLGLLLILPLLQLVGFSVAHHATHGLTDAITRVFYHLHLSLTLFNILISYIIIICSVAWVAYAEQTLSTQLQQKYTCHLRTKLHRQLLQTAWPFFLKRKMSDLLYTLTAQVQGVSMCNHQLLSLINTLVLTFIYTGLALLLSWPMTLLAIVCALFLLCFMRPLHRITSQAGLDHLQKNQAMTQSIFEQLSALKMIKGSGLEDTFADQLLRIGTELEHQNQQLSSFTAKSKLLYHCGSVILFSLLLWVSLSIFKIPLDELLLLLIVFSRLLPMISSAQQIHQRILHHLPAYTDIQRLSKDCLMNQDLILQASIEPISFQNNITLEQVSFYYAEETPIIHQLSFQLKKNTTTALVGPSGAGKSTVADLIVGLLAPTAGKITIDNQPLTPNNTLAWRKTIAYVTQDVFLFNTTLRDNLTLFSPNQTDQTLWATLRMASADFVTDLRDGLDTVLGDRGVRLSGGERQRIALARALLMKPSFRT